MKTYYFKKTYKQSNRNYAKMQMLLFLFFCFFLDANVAGDKKWAVGLFMQADGDLAKPAAATLDSLVRALAGKKNSPLKVVAEIGDLQGSTRYLIDEYGLHVIARQRFLQPAERLTLFCAFFKNIQAQRTLLIFSGHGSGVLKPQWNESLKKWYYEPDEGDSYYAAYQKRKNIFFADLIYPSAHYKSLFLSPDIESIDSKQLAHIFATNLPTKLDIIGFDACHMGMVEIAYDLRSVANYMIASQECEEHSGWDYAGLISVLEQNESPLCVARNIVYSYEKSQRSKNHSTFSLSSCDLAFIDPLTWSCLQIVEQMKKCMHIYKQEFRDLLCLVRQKNQRFCFIPMYADLYCFFDVLYEELSALYVTHELEVLKKKLLEAMELHRRMTLAAIAGSSCPNAQGCSLYFPFNHCDTSYKNNAWATTSGWHSFLDLFLGGFTE